LTFSSHVAFTLFLQLAEIVPEGEAVWVKVIGITHDQKIQLSMKYVGQSDGRDLDSNQVELAMQGQRSRPAKESKVITLGAVLKTTCARCGGSGHLTKECYASEGGLSQKKYELIASPPREEENANNTPPKPLTAAEKYAQREKEALAAALKSLSDSDSSNGERTDKKRKKSHHHHSKHDKKHKHEKKHKKEKHSH